MASVAIGGETAALGGAAGGGAAGGGATDGVRAGEGAAAAGGDEAARGGAGGLVGPVVPVVRRGDPRVGPGRGGADGRSGLGAPSCVAPATSVTTTGFLGCVSSSSSYGFFALASVLEMFDPFRSAASFMFAASAFALDALISRAASRPLASSSGFGAGVSLKPPPRATAPVEPGRWLWQKVSRHRAARRRWPSIPGERCRPLLLFSQGAAAT